MIGGAGDQCFQKLLEIREKKDGSTVGVALQELADGRHFTRIGGDWVARRERKASYALVFVDAVATFYSVVRDTLWGPFRTLRFKWSLQRQK